MASRGLRPYRMKTRGGPGSKQGGGRSAIVAKGKRCHLTISSTYSALRGGKFMYRGERKELPMGPPKHRDGIEQLVTDFQNGYLTRRGFLAKATWRTWPRTKPTRSPTS